MARAKIDHSTAAAASALQAERCQAIAAAIQGLYRQAEAERLKALRPITAQQHADKMLSIWQAERKAGVPVEQRLGGEQ